MKATSETHMKGAAQNVWLILTAQEIEPVLEINVKTHALAHVELMRNVQWLITPQHAIVYWVTLVTLFADVIMFRVSILSILE